MDARTKRGWDFKATKKKRIYKLLKNGLDEYRGLKLSEPVRFQVRKRSRPEELSDFFSPVWREKK